MGSIEYFIPELTREIRVLVPPEGLKYIITCEHPRYTPFNSYLKTLRQKFQKAIKDNKSLELSLYDLRPYPTLVKKILTGQRNVVYYFESMDENSHNQTLIKELNRIKKANPELVDRKPFQDLVQHVYDCTVQLGKIEEGKVLIWYPDGLREGKIDTSYVRELSDEEYFTTHGKRVNGARFAIRTIEDKKVISGLKELNKLWKRLWEE